MYCFMLLLIEYITHSHIEYITHTHIIRLKSLQSLLMVNYLINC